MTETFDGRATAWVSAWSCLESAQKTRIAATEVQDKRERNGDKSDASYYFSRMTQQYNALMEEARILAALAAVPDHTVGFYAGNWLQRIQEQRDHEEAMRADFIDRFTKTEGGQDDANS